MSIYTQPIDYNSAFPTGGALLGSQLVVSAIVDADTVTLGNLIGAITTLYNARMFKQYGVKTPDEMAEYYTEMELIVGSLCDAIAECIETSQAVKDALNNAVAGNGGLGSSGGDLGSGGLSPIPTSVDNTTNLIAGSICTDDNLYGIAIGIVDISMTIVTDAYEKIAFLTATLDLLAEMADNFPTWVGSAVNASLDTAKWIRDTAFVAFQSFDTLAVRQDIACDLWCIMVDNNCSITYDDIAQYFIGRSTVGILNRTLADVLPDLVGLGQADPIGYSSLGILFGTLNLGARFGGILGATQYMGAIQDKLDESNPNWVSCDPCNTWEYIVDFDNLPQQFNVVTGIISGGRLNIDGSLQNPQCDIRFVIPQTNITSIEFGGFNVGASNDSESFSGIDTTPTPVITLLGGAQTNGANRDFVWSGNRLIESMRFFCESIPPSDGWISKIILRGTGANPFI